MSLSVLAASDGLAVLGNGAVMPQFEWELPRKVGAPGVARRLLADWVAPASGDGTIATARLMVSELVANAVRHGHGTITLRAHLS